jgi:RHS repeat-associated protein
MRCSATNSTGKERDSESGLDDFEARYYGSSLGRFRRPDPSSVDGDVVDRESPQGWNMYSYVLNNPTTAVDPDGLDCIYINNDTGKYEGFNRGDCDNSTAEKANSGYYVNGTVDYLCQL